MRSDTRGRTKSIPEAEVELRSDRLDMMSFCLGCQNDTELAALIGVTERTIRRARREGIIGEKLMRLTVAAAQRHEKKIARVGLKPTFDEFFAVRTKAA